MKASRFVILGLAGTLLLCSVLFAQARITTVEPSNAKPGETVTANGEGIDKSIVDTIYLTDGNNDFKCDMVEQSAKSIKFKVPSDMKKGRWALMVHIKTGQLLQQPVRLTVE
jgi:hypothetical protein